MPAVHPLRLLRLCFIVLFGAMSLMHGPIMVYGPPHAPVTDHAGHDKHPGPESPASRSDAAMCNSFACFLAVAPIALSARPLHAIMIGTMALRPQSKLTAALQSPDIPPPRFHG